MNQSSTLIFDFHGIRMHVDVSSFSPQDVRLEGYVSRSTCLYRKHVDNQPNVTCSDCKLLGWFYDDDDDRIRILLFQGVSMFGFSIRSNHSRDFQRRRKATI
mmetsp:Transcript_1421/g.2803  ORF Transcript_1421/g.2803 Transcript_1421/m.2803 type:complete len:102 (-) Transcript_1421:312-617(-)